MTGPVFEVSARPRPRVIGLSGKAGTGKSWITTNILRPLGFREWSLAWHFKVFLAGQGRATYEEVFHTKPPHIRALLQQEGTERGRDLYGEDIWTNTSEQWMNLLAEAWGETRFVIPDIRFPNEVEFIKRMGGRVYRVIAPTRSLTSGLSEAARTHVSETSLDTYEGFDGFIANDPEFTRQTGDQVRALLHQHNIISQTEIENG